MRTLRFLLALFLLVTFFITAQEIRFVEMEIQYKEFPISREYLEFLEKERTGVPQKQNFGHIPFRYKLGGKIPNSFFADPNLPSNFDLREGNTLTPVKDQTTCGSCWTFSTLAGLEARMKKLGMGEYDLSENNLKNRHGFLKEPCSGGNIFMATTYFTNEMGPVLEADDPYNPSSGVSPEGLLPAAYIDEAWLLPNRVINELEDLIPFVKQNIYAHGALTTSMFWEDQYYNKQENTYYVESSGEPTNHEVLLVGWDDDKITSAAQPGAWIIRNSWGSDWGDDGYFYLSFWDAKVLDNIILYPSPKVHNPQTTNYYYDDYGARKFIRPWDKETLYGIVKFTAKDEKQINKISTWLPVQEPSKITARILDKDLKIIMEIPEREYNYMGYASIDLPSPISIPENEDFYIWMKYHIPGDTVYMPFEAKDSFADPEIEENRSFIGHDGLNFAPIGKNTVLEADLCIRAYASDPVEDQNIIVSVDSLIFGKKYKEKPLINDEQNPSNEFMIVKNYKRATTCTDKNILHDKASPFLSKINSEYDTLFYDDGIAAGFYYWEPGTRLGARMTPAKECKIKAVQIACSKEQNYKIGIYNWTGVKPGAEIFESAIITSPGKIWHTTSIESENIYLDNDFIVSFNMLDTSASVGYNQTNNGRAWDFNGSQWSAWNETYLIRAIVEYESGDLDTIANFTITNNGGLPLTVSGFESNVSWMVSVEPTAFVIPAGESQEVKVEVNPTGLSKNEYFGDLKIFSNDPDENPYNLPVKLINNKIVSVKEKLIVTDYQLLQNYPNPFNPSTKIKYSIPENQNVVLKVFDILGKEISTLVNEKKQIGNYEVEFSADYLSSGIYFYRIQAGEFIDTKKFVLIK